MHLLTRKIALQCYLESKKIVLKMLMKYPEYMETFANFEKHEVLQQEIFSKSWKVLYVNFMDSKIYR